MPGKAAIQAAFGRRRVWTRKGPFSCPSVAMSVRTRPMFAIPFAVNLGSVAVISRRCGILGCNERAHGPPMFAIPTPDVCRSLHVVDHGGPVACLGYRQQGNRVNILRGDQACEKVVI